jgi:hypothetical protein
MNKSIQKILLVLVLGLVIDLPSLSAQTPTPTPTATPTPTPHAINLTNTQVYKAGTNLNAVLRAIDDGHGAYVPAFILVDSNGDPVSLGGGGGGDASAANQATQIVAEQAIRATVGAATGPAVTSNSDGTLQQYLRGLVSLWNDGMHAGTNIIGKVGIDQTAPGATNAVSIDQTTPGTTNAVAITGTEITIVVKTVASGGHVNNARHIEFILSSDFVGTIDGEAITGAALAIYNPGDAPIGSTFAQLDYEISAGNAILTHW